MKIDSSLLKAVLITCLLIPALTVAGEPEPNSIDYAHTDARLTPCGLEKSEKEISLLPPPSETKTGIITYVTGGICVDGVRHMKDIANNYPLEIVLVEQEGKKELYLADVNINIFDAEEKLILNVSTEGPFLLAELPNGIYQITAEFNAVMKIKRVNINNKQHKRVVFLWSASDHPN